MEGQHKGRVIGGSTFNVIPSTELQAIKAKGFNEILGFVDNAEGVVYLPTIDSLNGKLTSTGLTEEQFKSVMGAYFELGTACERLGYQRRHIV